MKTTNSEVKTSNLNKLFTLKGVKAKTGRTIYLGDDSNMNHFIGFMYDVKDSKDGKSKTPRMKIYENIKGQKITKDSPVLVTLWSNMSKAGKEYLSGKDNENKPVQGHFDNVTDEIDICEVLDNESK